MHLVGWFIWIHNTSCVLPCEIFTPYLYCKQLFVRFRWWIPSLISYKVLNILQLRCKASLSLCWVPLERTPSVRLAVFVQQLQNSCTFLTPQSVVTTGPQPLPRRVLHWLRSSAYSVLRSSASSVLRSSASSVLRSSASSVLRYLWKTVKEISLVCCIGWT
jgi:hypothetical protein